MVAIIGGQTQSFRPLIDLYREEWKQGGESSQNQIHQFKVGIIH